MKTLSLENMENTTAGFGCGLAWFGLGVAFVGVVVAGAASAGAGWAVGGYLLSIVDVGVACS